MEPDSVYDYGAFQVSPVRLHHDVPNFGFRVFADGQKAIYAVDTGYIDDVRAPDYDLFMVEANHKEDEIKERLRQKRSAGEYAYETRAMATHLSEEQAMKWLANNAGTKSEYVLLHQHIDRESVEETRNKEGLNGRNYEEGE